MEEDDEIQSHHSQDTGSPGSPRRNGRITVTVAAAPPGPATGAHNAITTLALPIQRPRSGGGGGGGGTGGGGGREDCWSEGATAVLIDAWGERYLQLSRGNLKQKHWKEVADIVSSREDYGKIPKTDIQCKNRIDTVKKKYKVEKAKAASGTGPSKWPFFERLDQLIGPAAKVAVSSPPLQLQKVPLAIPVRIRSASVNHYNSSQFLNKPQKKQDEEVVGLRSGSGQRMLPSRKRSRVESESEPEPEPEPEPEDADSLDSFPRSGTNERKRPRTMTVMGREGRGGGKGGWGNAVRELTQAILRFGEAYEQAESAKVQQVVEMEKQRMKFAKELELQRMQFFMKTQLEISQLKKHGGRRAVGGGGNANNHHINNNNNINHSDSSS